MFVTTSLLLSRQAYFSRDKSMLVATNTYLSQQIVVTLVATKIFCRGKYTFVATKDVFCHDKHVFVTWLSRQTRVPPPFQTRVCRDKTFVATKVILVAAPANNS